MVYHSHSECETFCRIWLYRHFISCKIKRLPIKQLLSNFEKTDGFGIFKTFFISMTWLMKHKHLTKTNVLIVFVYICSNPCCFGVLFITEISVWFFGFGKKTNLLNPGLIETTTHLFGTDGIANKNDTHNLKLLNAIFKPKLYASTKLFLQTLNHFKIHLLTQNV